MKMNHLLTREGAQRAAPRRTLFAALLTLFALSFAAAPARAQTALTVFAAASLTDAFTEISETFTAENPDISVVFNFGSSTTLATQLVEGAPADVFASANARQMEVAREGGRIAGTPRTFVKNRLVLIVPSDNPAGIQSLRDLANEGVNLVVAAPSVPVRDYTDTMLQRLAADPSYGEAYQAAVIANIASEEDNVRQVFLKVALGEADAGIVYRSDVTPDSADQVMIFPIPDALNTIAAYPIAVTNDSANPEQAQAFIDYVLSDTGQNILVKWGFISARIPPVPATITFPDEGLLSFDGQVLNPLLLDVEAVRANFTPYTVEATYLSGEETVTATFTGVLLWDVISAAQPNFNADVRNDKLGMYIVATGRDGYQAAISLGEIDPEFGGAQILVAYDQDGQPLAEGDGPFRLVVPDDARGGRYVRQLANLSLRDAPTP
jgi:molybdate transport system substrate-binding protein